MLCWALWRLAISASCFPTVMRKTALRLAYGRVRQAGYQIVNLDCIVFAQRPKLSAHKEAIQERIAEILQITSTCIGVKAKTGEGVDAVGREEAIMAQCVALVEAESLPSEPRIGIRVE
jgi:2-C-methyl-D-erythritol 2,4-cyclodiphosphate synthase